VPFDPRLLASTVRGWGNRISPAILEGSQALYAEFHEREPYSGVNVTRDIAYGAHERQRLDLFFPQSQPACAAALVFVHGGGFVGGDKKRPGTPYHDNIALWAARHGLLGVNMTYRHAPVFPWPSGAEDVAAAVQWLRAHLGRGAPDRIYVMGTSAGAVHVAGYVAQSAFHAEGGSGLAGAILLSGLYDVETAERNKLLKSYFGEDPARYAERSALKGLIESPVPLMFGLAEYDPPDFECQALQLLNAYYERHRRWPRLVRLMGHNHFTATLHLNTPDDCLGRQILAFME
jgi:acetyl esterase/lipase